MFTLTAIAPFYAALTGLLLVFLSWRVVTLRHKYQSERMNEEAHSVLTAATRAQAHLLEYAPIALLLLLLAELQGTSAIVLHALGATFVIARIIHLRGINDPSGKSRARRLGTRLTWLQIIAASLVCLLSCFGLFI